MNFVSLYLAKGYNIQELYVDTVGDPKKYQAMLKSRFPSIGTIVVESKADATYPIVSAASICAKVTRDEALRNWVFREAEHGVQISTTLGCGYPSDGITKKWLADHTDPVFGFPDLTRFSWSTSSNMLKKQEAHVVTWGDENDENPRQQQKLGKFFTKSETGVTGADATNVPLKSRSYISRRGHLNIVSSLSLPVGGGDNK
jgi:ribonuclease H2 subunit A